MWGNMLQWIGIEWWCFVSRTVVQERQFDAICQRILNAKKHFVNVKQSLMQLKHNKPRTVSQFSTVFPALWTVVEFSW